MPWNFDAGRVVDWERGLSEPLRAYCFSDFETRLKTSWEQEGRDGDSAWPLEADAWQC